MGKVKERDILEQLKEAGQNMTADDLREQKISFIMGSLSENSEITREEVEAALNKSAGEPPRS